MNIKSISTDCTYETDDDIEKKQTLDLVDPRK